MERKPYITHCFAVVVCRNLEGQWLAVKETHNRGWWLPAGAVEAGETFAQAAYRETLSEAGIQIDLKGILRIEHSVYPNAIARMRVIYFAMPADPTQRPKSMPDKISDEARWVTLEELKILSQKPPGLRGPELFEWGNYIENGGLIAPLSFLSREEDALPPTTQTATSSAMPSTPDPTLMLSPEDLVRTFTEAIERNDDATVKRMLLAGCDPNMIINNKAWTGLHYAIKCNHENVVSALLFGGAEITACTLNRRNCVHFASQSTLSILGMLLIRLQVLPASKRMEIVNAQDVKGETPLHFAAKVFSKTAMWNMLVQNGADQSIRNMEGKTAGDLAMLVKPSQ